MIIYCDMDGVLCDFERQWARVNKLPFSKFSSLNMHDRWEKVRQHGSYWETIPWKGDVEIGSYPFFHAGKLGVSIVIRSEDQNKIDDCNSQILKFVNEKKIEVVDR